MSKEQKGRLLIVEDAPTDLQYLMNILSEEGYDVCPATGGESALQIVRSVSPDLILLNTLLPGMDGFQVCQQLKEGENTREIPVIFIYSAAQTFDKAKAFAVGGADYLDKPFQSEEVLRRVETQLSLRKLQQHLEGRVDERTTEMSNANVSLNREIAERKKVEAALRQAHQDYAVFVDSFDGIVWEADAQTFRFTFVSNKAERLLGFPVERWVSDPNFWKDHIHPEDREWAITFCVTAVNEKRDHDVEYRMIAADGRTVWLRDIVSVVVENDKSVKLRGIMVDITTHKREEALRAGQSRILEMIATSAPIEDIFVSLIYLIESQSEGMLCSILLLDEAGKRLRHGAAPSLPEAYIRAVDGVAIGPQVGSCGTAAFLGEPVIVTDILSDPRWHEYRDLAVKFGLRACWSSPIISHQGLVLGAFAMYYREPRNPVPHETQLIAIATHLAGIAIERQASEKERRDSEQRYRTLVENAPEALVVLDLDTGLFVDTNDKAVQLFGLPRETLFRISLFDLSSPTQPDSRDSQQVALEKIQQTMNGEAPVFEWMHRNASGKDIPCEVRLVRIPSHGRRLIRGSIIDISERRKVDEALRASEKRFTTAFQASPNPLTITTLKEGRFLAVNEQFLAISGYTREEVIGHTVFELNLWDKVQDRDRAIQMLKKQGVVRNFEGNMRTKSGELRFMIIALEAIELEGQECLLMASNDITERKRAEAELQRSSREISDLYHNAPCGYHALNKDGTFIRINKTELDWLGYSSDEVIGKMNIADLIATESRVDFQECFTRLKQHGTLTDLEIEMMRKDGTTIPVLLSATAILDDEGNLQMVNSTLFDITERKRLEDQFRQSQKMEAVGRLAGGIAHDFNNLLTAILGYSQLALLHLKPHEVMHEQIEEIRKAAERAALLTSQLLAFSRRQILQPKVLNLNDAIEEMDNMLRRLIGEDIELLTQLDTALGRVKADPGQIAQVILNLSVNARDAMPLGGKLMIETANVDLDEEYAHSHLSVPSGPFVMLAVSDTGHGIAEEHKMQIFEPFFTTKEQGKGTGLGLSTIYGIIKQSGGSILVSSDVGQGTRFQIYLPRIEAKQEAGVTGVSKEIDHGKETILLVEDEEIVRKLAVTILKRSGYTVLEANGGGEALLRCERYAGEIHLLVTDILMPQMSGRELAERLTPLRPEMKVLYMSGYTDDEFIHRGILELDTAFMQKPFTPDYLLQRVCEVLNSKNQ
jgi:two-component system, cell cycle sensor histidine kinase and response regulator CckA